MKRDPMEHLVGLKVAVITILIAFSILNGTRMSVF